MGRKSTATVANKLYMYVKIAQVIFHPTPKLRSDIYDKNGI